MTQTISESLDVIAEHFPGAQFATVEGHVREVLVYRDAFAEAAVQDDRLPRPPADLSPADVIESFRLARVLGAMLRAAIVFSDQVHGDLLSIVTGDQRATVRGLVEHEPTRRRLGQKLDAAVLLDVFRIRMFRNELLTHPPVGLVAGRSSWIDDARSMRLDPMLWGAEIPSDDYDEVVALGEAWQHTTPQLVEELSSHRNMWNLLQGLFDGVPPLKVDGSKQEDRKRIDDLVGKYGHMKSTTMMETIEVMSRFFVAVADVVVANPTDFVSP